MGCEHTLGVRKEGKRVRGYEGERGAAAGGRKHMAYGAVTTLKLRCRSPTAVMPVGAVATLGAVMGEMAI